MDRLTHVAAVFALTMGAAWASGINLYAAIFMLGIMDMIEGEQLSPRLEVLSHPAVLVVAGFMHVVEFVADRVPGVDTGWDTLHTFIRMPAGAVLAAGAAGTEEPVLTLAAALVGGNVAATVHEAKAGRRMLISASPEPVSNWRFPRPKISAWWAACCWPFTIRSCFWPFLRPSSLLSLNLGRSEKNPVFWAICSAPEMSRAESRHDVQSRLCQRTALWPPRYNSAVGGYPA